jgi:hypothetical protein
VRWKLCFKTSQDCFVERKMRARETRQPARPSRLASTGSFRASNDPDDGCRLCSPLQPVCVLAHYLVRRSRRPAGRRHQSCRTTATSAAMLSQISATGALSPEPRSPIQIWCEPIPVLFWPASATFPASRQAYSVLLREVEGRLCLSVWIVRVKIYSPGRTDIVSAGSSLASVCVCVLVCSSGNQN